MDIATGHTVYEMIRSFEPDTNLPVVPALFVSKTYTDGILNSGVVVDISLSDATEGMYVASWSASTLGTYQLHVENTSTKVEVIYVSEIYVVKSDSDISKSTTVYVGL